MCIFDSGNEVDLILSLACVNVLICRNQRNQALSQLPASDVSLLRFLPVCFLSITFSLSLLSLGRVSLSMMFSTTRTMKAHDDKHYPQTHCTDHVLTHHPPWPTKPTEITPNLTFSHNMTVQIIQTIYFLKAHNSLSPLTHWTLNHCQFTEA